ncbi:MAG: wax ester/triacylglycerol synthase family O-acyltransferase [Anaerolineae bacterium]
MSEDMSNVDTAWLRMEMPNNLMMITGVFVFDEPLDFERFKTTLEQRFITFDRFRQRVVETRRGARWEVDPHFDIVNHIHRIALPAPGDQTALQELVSDLMSTPLDFTKPLWQFHLVEGYQGGSAWICRLHHCIGDGISLMRVLLAMTDQSRDAVWQSPAAAEGTQRSRSPWRIVTGPATAAIDATRRVTGAVISGGIDLLANPGQALEYARLGNETTMALGRLLLLPPDPKTIYKGPLEVPKRVVWSEAISLPKVKAIGRATGSTVNDVLLSAVAGALRRYAQTRAQPVEGLNVRGAIPVNLRQESATIELGNHFGLVFLALPLGIDDPLDRLFELKRRMDDLKNSQEAVVVFGILNAIGMAPSEIEDLVVTIFGAKATVVMTNVPGPRQQIYFAGAPVRELMFWVPQSGRLGLGVSIFSYNDQVWLGVATDQSLVPDPETIVAYYGQEIDYLYALIQQAAEAPPENAAPTPPNEPAPAAPVPAPPASKAARQGGDDLTRLVGIGPAYAARLTAGGIDTFAALAASSPDALAAIVQAPDWRRPDYISWIDQAQAGV